MPTNTKVYDGTGDPEDHTLNGKARAWFDKLPPGSIDNWGDLQEKFLNRFGMLKACAKDPTKISKIVRKANENLPAFKEMWVGPESSLRGALVFSELIEKTIRVSLAPGVILGPSSGVRAAYPRGEQDPLNPGLTACRRFLP
nr:hypothetical protein [Tanacetum cinerariifolium]